MLDEDDFSFDLEDDEEEEEEEETISVKDLEDGEEEEEKEVVAEEPSEEDEEKEVVAEEPSEEEEETVTVDEPSVCPECNCDPCECDTPRPSSDLEMLRAKLKKSLAELEELKGDMQNTFTSSDTLSMTIQSLRGMLDALKKDQMNILSNQ
jgi:hypothetical protein